LPEFGASILPLSFREGNVANAVIRLERVAEVVMLADAIA